MTGCRNRATHLLTTRIIGSRMLVTMVTALFAFMAFTGTFFALVASTSTLRATFTLAIGALCAVVTARALAFTLGTALRTLADASLFGVPTGFAIVSLALPLVAARRTCAHHPLTTVRTRFAFMPLAST